MSFIGAANTGNGLFHPPRTNDNTFVSAASAIYVGSWVGTALTPLDILYNALSGVTTVTVANHGLRTSSTIGFATV